MISNKTDLGKIPVLNNQSNICLVAATYYKDITQSLIRGCSEILEKLDMEINIVEVSGALEIPTAIKLLENKYDGFVAIGCVIRGETSHYEIVSEESARAISKLGLQRLCIGNCILTVENERQAQERADPLGQNKGGEATIAMLQLLKIKEYEKKKSAKKT
jgi:6,7-dimethyl-8-ribityllumazine synthase